MREPSNLPACQYPKLVRDRMPEIIRRDNHTPVFKTVQGWQKLDALFRKLMEEAAELEEAFYAEPSDVVSELADLSEVIRQIGFEFGIDPVEVDVARVEKSGRRGGFKQGIYMIEVKKNEL